MRKWVKWLLVLVVIGIIGAAGMWWYVFHKPALNVFNEKASLEVTAKNLISDFSANETKAYSVYTNKENTMVISVTGTIAGIENTDSTSVITLENPLLGVTCEFKSDYFSKQKDKLKSLANGQSLKVKGKCNGFLKDELYSFVKIDNCVIE